MTNIKVMSFTVYSLLSTVWLGGGGAEEHTCMENVALACVLHEICRSTVYRLFVCRLKRLGWFTQLPYRSF